MRIKDVKGVDTIEDQVYRENLIMGESRKTLPFLGLLILLALISALFISRYNLAYNTSRGNPYNCESCRSLQMACKEHKDYNTEQALTEKVTRFVNRYNIKDKSGLTALYGYTNTYNTECDFCIASKSECYGCRSDRLNLIDKYNTISKSSIFITKLCDNCWSNNKTVNCDLCREILITDIISSLKGIE